jgi:hypothetical protein
MKNDIIGVNRPPERDYCSYQIITRDGQISKFPDKMNWSELKNQIIPKGSHISKVETITNNSNSYLSGFKFFGSDGSVLLSIGEIDDPDSRSYSGNTITTTTLKENERLIGVKSSSGGEN